MSRRGREDPAFPALGYLRTISLRLPESLHAQARLLAEQECISIKQLIATSLAKKMSALLTGEYLKARAIQRNLRCDEAKAGRPLAVG